jgi:hypothetical protein
LGVSCFDLLEIELKPWSRALQASGSVEMGDSEERGMGGAGRSWGGGERWVSYEQSSPLGVPSPARPHPPLRRVLMSSCSTFCMYPT